MGLTFDSGSRQSFRFGRIGINKEVDLCLVYPVSIAYSIGCLSRLKQDWWTKVDPVNSSRWSNWTSLCQGGPLGQYDKGSGLVIGILDWIEQETIPQSRRASWTGSDLFSPFPERREGRILRITRYRPIQWTKSGRETSLWQFAECLLCEGN